MANDRHLSVADFAERENVSIQTVYQWNKDGTGPRYMRVGKYVRYRLVDVVNWENSRYVERANGSGAA